MPEDGAPPSAFPQAAPAGMGYFSLSVNSSAALTILPTAPVFKTYKLIFKPVDGNNSQIVLFAPAAGTIEDILLFAGRWDLVVEAYTGEGDAENPPSGLAAEGDFLNFLIGNGGVTGGSVTLSPLASGNGTFRWTVTYPDNVTSGNAVMRVTRYASGTYEDIPLTGETEPADTVLSAGYYTVDISLTSSDGKTASMTKVLHIFPNMVSVFSHNFTASNFSASHDESKETVTIEGNPIEGQVLTVNISGLAGTGQIYYMWYRGTSPAGTGASYAITSANGDTLGTQIKVEAYRVGYNGSVTSDAVTVEALTVTSIEAVYTQTGTFFKSTDDLDILKNNLVVTAFYNDGSEEILSGYTLSGTLVEGTTNEITVTYEGHTDTFDVEVGTVIQPDFAFTLNADGTYSIGRSPDAEGDVVIPGWINGIQVTTIDADAFRDNTRITSVVIPEGVTSIGDLAFFSCSSLTNITIPEGVTFISNYAFSNCTSLTEVTIPSSVTSIGGYAFANCTSLTSIEIPEGVEFIDSVAFSGCTSLTEVTIPSSVTSIGNGAFSDCTSLTSIEIPEGVEFIYVEAFSGCTSLTSVTIPDSVTYIGDRSFLGCNSLTSINVAADNPNYASQNGVLYNKGMTKLIDAPGISGDFTIPDSVTSILGFAFFNCTSLTSLTIHLNVTIIGIEDDDGEFIDFLWILNNTSINVAAGNPNYASQNGILYNKEMTKLIAAPGISGAFTIPDSVTSIGYGAFYECSSLTNIEIPEGVEFIYAEAFSGCTSLTSVIIPSSVTSIGDLAFYDTNITEVTFDGDDTEISSISFLYRAISLDTVYMPSLGGSGAGTYVITGTTWVKEP